jgi:hypothetical protein
MLHGEMKMGCRAKDYRCGSALPACGVQQRREATSATMNHSAQSIDIWGFFLFIKRVIFGIDSKSVK